MFKKITAVLLASSILLLPFTAGLADASGVRRRASIDYGEAIKTARETMWKSIAGGFCSGATVAVADEGKIVYAEGFGAADRAANRPVNAETRFNVGSTSKMFAAVGILLLVDDGKVRLDDPVAKYLPEFRMKDPRYKDITVRMLFNHSSGLPGSHFYFGYAVDENMHRYLIDSMAEAYLKHEPGAMQIYCNDGFTLAEMIVERVSGEKFIDFLARRVFKPLGMKNTGVSVGEAGVGNTAEYYNLKNGKKYPREVVMVYGAGGLSSTASDMCRFASSFSPFAKRVLSDASVAEILKSQPTKFFDKLRGPQILNEFGWDYSSLPDYQAAGIQVLAKSGGTTCYSTYMQTVPKYGVTVVYSITGSVADLEELSRPILDAVMRAKKIAIPGPEPVEKPAEARPVPEEMLKFEGYYCNADSVVRVRFDRAGGKMELAAPAEAAPGASKEEPAVMSLVHNDGYFYYHEKKMTLYFTVVDGRTYIAAHKLPNYGVDTLMYQKIDKIETPKKLRADIAGKKWLVRNMPAQVVYAMVGLVEAKAYEALPGYVSFGGLKKIESPDYAEIAATAFRDQASLKLVDVNGETWIKSNMFMYSSEDTARKLVSGVNRVTIKTEQWNEWLKSDKGAVVKLGELPAGSRVMAAGGEGLVFDSAVNKGEFYLPKGGLIIFAGSPGDMFKVYAY